MTVAPTHRVLIAATGNSWRGDDAVGARVLRALTHRIPRDAATLFDSGGDVLSLVDAWAGFDAAICVDACEPSGSPGRIHRIDSETQALPRAGGTASSHAVGLADAIALTQALSQGPRRVVVYAVEGACFDSGAQVTAEVAVAAERVAECILADIGALQRGAWRINGAGPNQSGGMSAKVNRKMQPARTEMAESIAKNPK
jgi:hydrogenase maturation protease